MTSTESLKQLLALAAKATPGKWTHESTERDRVGVMFRRHLFNAHTECESANDASYIAACSPDVIAELVNELLAAREFIKRNREADEAIFKIERDE